MSLKEIKVRIPDLEIGMYVCRLDRPWLETPYLLQGFPIKSQDDINELLKYCEYVYVDVDRSSIVEKKPPVQSRHAENTDEAIEQLTGIKRVRYQDTTERTVELKTARASYRVLADVAQDIMDDIAHNKKLDFPSLQKAVDPMVDSIVRNPDAFAWLTRMKHKDDYIYNHSVSSSIWAVAFGRHLGLPRKDLQSLAIGALLFDVGKMKLPEKLIHNTERFNQFEFKLIKQHVQYSVDILRSIDGISEDVVEMVATHHERHNGKGYPRGLSGNQIPIFGKIAGIVDCFDAIISDRPFATSVSPHDAVKSLYEWRDVDFQSELIEQFIQVVGIYPVGTIVELSDGRVGVIIAQNRVWRLRPQVMLLLDESKQSYKNFDIINLFTDITGIDGQSLDIVRSVEPHMYGIDPQQYYI